MRVNITGINFQYDNGYEQDYTGVELQYILTGTDFTNNKPVLITKEQYEDNKGNTNNLRSLIVDEKVSEAEEYILSLNEYKNSLTVV